MRKPVVIAGGGVAALEAMIALHDLAGDLAQVTLVAPQPDFVYRPLSVVEPFGLGHAARYSLASLAADFDAGVVRTTLAEVDPAGHRAVLGDGSVLTYDALLIAIGARMEPAFVHAITFGAPGAAQALAGLLADLEGGSVRRVAFVLPTSTAWSLPLYELALMTARDIWSAGADDAQLALVTPEARPLEAFGGKASSMVAELLAQQRIEFIGSVTPEVHEHGVLAGERRLAVDRTVAMPVPVGPRIAGLPETADGFIGVDEHARVRGVTDVYAAGDATDAPIKQGGLAAQQAVAAAEAIAAACGADLDPEPFRPLLRGLLLTGGHERWLRAPTGGTPAATQASLEALWWPPAKIATRYLAPVLAGRETG
ncbi:MAG TPA: FAD/NAD(P)-binding oxidoreductase [Solirubrobacteraceae bacterium]|nr:FAD/NAD(P)-binding oxidoreductase [Solirubrobacteraceae bacterium]